MSTTLSRADVDRLMRDSSPATRADTAAKVARQIDVSELSKTELDLVEDICRLMLRDVEVQVRAALSENLKHCVAVPKDVALALARDVGEVALPVLEFSKVLSDEDLIEIIATQDTSKQIAIARRENVSADVADALVDSEKEEVVAELVANDSATVREATLAHIVQRFKDSDRVKTPLAQRSKLPVRVAEQLVSLVSEQLRQHLVSKHDLDKDLAKDIVDQSRERATMTLSGVDTAAELVRTLSANGRLTSSIIIRAVCMGDMFFFEWALAMLTKTPIENARTLVHDRDPRGLRSMLLRCGLPSVMFPIVRTAVDLWREMEFDGDELDRERYSRRMIERVITNFSDPSSRLDPGNLEYLLGKISELSAAGAVPQAAAAGE